MVSICRILLVPALVALILAPGSAASVGAAVLFAVGALSDGLDGYLARKYDTSTTTGQWLDPLADKALVAAPIITLAALGMFPVWAAVVIIVREVGVALLRVVLGSRGRSMPASIPAKLKTLTQLVAVTLYLLPLGSWADGLKLGVLIGAVVLTVWTGLQYAVRAASWLRAGGARPEGDATPREAG